MRPRRTKKSKSVILIWREAKESGALMVNIALRKMKKAKKKKEEEKRNFDRKNREEGENFNEPQHAAMQQARLAEPN